jgi:high affinity choline transporter 7
LVYVVLFPQLACVVHLKAANTYGAAAGWLFGMFFRLTGGEPLLGLPPLMKYPYYDDSTGVQNTPFKTICMLISLFFIITVSYLTRHLFTSGKLSAKYDVFKCFNDGANQSLTPSKYEMRQELTDGQTNPTYDQTESTPNGLQNAETAAAAADDYKVPTPTYTRTVEY